ncbi:hypothetical protein VNO78_26176 [Psophocarpus tetragonolobus]|uniref:F-box domain-containing protein n=1 Tax=Psophocarpus tetragonolobus TaxID=3891 RepID=A0AAN9S1J6_PSOTE
MSLVDKTFTSKVKNVEDSQDTSMMDLPDLVLECIFEKLPSTSLFQMTNVCRSSREMCVTDHLWERHMKQKWGKVIGQVAHKEWKCYVTSNENVQTLIHSKQKSLMRLLSFYWPFSWMKMKVNVNNNIKRPSYLPHDSFMTWYLALETGNFWFPAQVYNRENGRAGFMLSCYDAKLSYDAHNDTFRAKYPPHGKSGVVIEHDIPWERLRVSPIDTSPHDLHISNCLHDLGPGDHVGGMDSNMVYLTLHYVLIIDTVVLEFIQYTHDSCWRRTTICRKDHKEEGNEENGFYGGIRKIKNKDEISIWKSFWPSNVLD